MPQFWLIAIGYLFVAVNLQINGLGILFPTCMGYALLAGACWSLRDSQPIFKLGLLPAVALAVFTFPDLFSGMLVSDLDVLERIIYWPSMVLEMCLMAIVAVGLWREADIRGVGWLKGLVLLTAPIVVGAYLGWWFFPVSDNATLIASFVIYVIPAFYLAGVYAAAARRFAS